MFMFIARAALAIAFAAPVSLAAGKPVVYELGPASGFLYGCQPPCLCPIALYEDLTGSFELSFVASTPNWFDVYRVQDVDWLLDIGGKPVHVTGSGQYEIGGQVALMQHLQLDLSFDGAPARHFDSGLVQGGAGFPALTIDVALNGFYCFDEVFTIEAFPLDVGTPYCVSVANSSGQPAQIRAFGSTVVADNGLTLVATDCPTSKAGIFFFGSTPSQTPFGDGFLCIAPPVSRIPTPVSTGFSGTVLLPLDLQQPPLSTTVLPGTTWHFQLVFRDPPGGPKGFNLTDALTISFQ